MNNKDRLNDLKKQLETQSELIDFNVNAFTNINEESEILQPIDSQYVIIPKENTKIIRKKNQATKTFIKENKDALIVEMIEMRILHLKSIHTIVTYLMNNYDLKRSAAYTLIGIMKKEIEKNNLKSKSSIPSKIQDSIERLELLMEKAYENQQYKVVLNIQQELNKLQGLYIDHNKQLEEKIPTGFNVKIIKND